MKKQQNYHYLLFTLLAILVNSCIVIDDLDDDDDDTKVESITATINGSKFSATKDGFSLSDLGDDVDGDLDIDGDTYELGITGVDLKNGIFTSLTIILYGEDFSSLNVGDEFGAITEESLSNGFGFIGAVGTVASGSLIGSEDELGGTTLVKGTMNVKITKMDRENELISGTFSFVAFDGDDELAATVTDGEFKNVEW